MGEPVGIIGAGIIGLSAAMVLSSKHKVTIVARDMPGDLGLKWASPWAGAVFHPQRDSNKIQQDMQAQSFRYYGALAHLAPESGVQLLPATEYFDDRSDDSELWYKRLVPDYRLIPKSELPRGCTFGVKYTALAMNPLILLPWLKERLLAKGVEFVRAEVKSFDEARAITTARVIVNASGDGAKSLAGDDLVTPIRGQTMFVKTDFNELVMRDGSEYTYVIPRAGSGGAILGGVRSDRLDAEVDEDLKRDILMRVNRVTNDAFKNTDLRYVEDIVGFRPGRKGGLRVERTGDVVHAYALEGAGYIFSFGVAERVNKLVDEVFRARL